MVAPFGGKCARPVVGTLIGFILLASVWKFHLGLNGLGDASSEVTLPGRKKEAEESVESQPDKVIPSRVETSPDEPLNQQVKPWESDRVGDDPTTGGLNAVDKCSDSESILRGAELGRYLVGERFCKRYGKNTKLTSWVQQDLLPWRETGITQKMINEGTQLGKRASRIQIIGGKLFAKVNGESQGKSRIWYWLWGLQELLDKYKGVVPDVDMAFQTQDSPQCPIRSKVPKDKRNAAKHEEYQPGNVAKGPPPVFSAVTTANNYDLLWPLWTIWGEDVQGASSTTGGFHDPNWRELHGSLIQAARSNPWRDRKHARPFWRGSTKTNSLRADLIKCSRRRKEATIPDADNVQHKEKVGRPVSAIERVLHRYLIYVDGKTFSGGQLPMIPTGAVLLLHASEFVTLHTRALRSTGYHADFFVNSPEGICENISAVVRGLNDDELGTGDLAAKALEWAAHQLSMESIEVYMLEMLQAYAKLQRYNVKQTGGTRELSWSQIRKNVKRRKV